MKFRNIRLILTAIYAVSVAHHAIAEESDELVDATDPENIVAIMQDLGYRAKLDVDNDGEPVIRSSTGGSQFSIQFYNCTADNHDQCKAVLFAISYNLDDELEFDVINAWNKAALFDHAYLDDDGDPALELGVNMHGGVSREAFEDTIGIWERRVGDFEKHVGF